MRRRKIAISVAVAALLTMGTAGLVIAEVGQAGDEQHVSMLAMKFDYLPSEITVKKGKPVVLELSALDRLHGFDVPALGLHAAIEPGAPTILRFTPEQAGKYDLHCDRFCGDGHEDMTARIIVTD